VRKQIQVADFKYRSRMVIVGFLFNVDIGQLEPLILTLSILKFILTVSIARGPSRNNTKALVDLNMRVVYSSCLVYDVQRQIPDQDIFSIICAVSPQSGHSKLGALS